MSWPSLIHDETGEALEIGLPNGALYDTDAHSTARVKIGDPVIDKRRVAFAGVGGSFEEHQGCRGRVILWEGEIRATDAGLAAIRASADAVKLLSGTFTFTDDDETTYENCTVDLVEIDYKRRLTNSDYTWWVPYRVQIFQLDV